MFRKIPLIAAMVMTACLSSGAFAQMKIVVNNVGYEKSGVKRAIIMSPAAPSTADAPRVDIVNNAGTVVGQTGYTNGSAWKRSAQWSVDGYQYFNVIDFTEFKDPGDGYTLQTGTLTSPAFSIGDKILQTKTGADQVNFFNKMRNTDEGDAALPVFGSSGTHNLYGGWWDATGDPGKHLSHLAYSNYFTPQQIPMVVWALLHAAEAQPSAFGAAAKSEAAWGADYLLRSLAPAGYFYMSVFDNWGDRYRYTEQPSGSRGEREICAWGTIDGLTPNTDGGDGTFNSDGIRSADYQSAMREGAGVSIAALARAAKANISGDSSAAQYLAGAERAYAHLLTNPTKYQDDGKQNIIDFYTGLLAATELYHATGESQYRVEARRWVDSLRTLQDAQGWFYSGNDAKGLARPFYHAAEEGFPVVALSRFYHVAATPGEKLMLREVVGKNLRWYNSITYDQSNPFEYARMYRARSEPLGGSGGGGPQDLARGKAATASREEGSFTAAKAFDGVTSNDSRWSSYENGAENDGQWIAVDLGGIYQINRVVLNWEAAYGKSYRIEVSSNKTAWTPVVTVTNNTAAGRVEHTFPPVSASNVRMYGVERGLEHGGFSLIDFEVYGEANDAPPAPYQPAFFIPKVNETGYWWQGENARLASMASAFILGAPIADHTGVMWSDTLFGMATAQLDWILGRNPFDLTMMYGYSSHRKDDAGYQEYPHYPATRALDNIKGGICNGISSARANENNIEWMPYGGEEFWRNWRFVEQWLPHNAWYLIAISSLSYRIDNEIIPEIISVKHSPAARQQRVRLSADRNRNVRITMPFAADHGTEVVMYNIQGRKIFAHNVMEGSRYVSMKLPAAIARGMYVISVKDAAGKNRLSGRIHLK